MSGKKGRSGRKPSGSRALAFAAVAPAVPQAAVGPVPASVVDGLQAPGQRFVASMWEFYGTWSPDALVLLREAGGVVDALAAYQEVLAADGRVWPGRPRRLRAR